MQKQLPVRPAPTSPCNAQTKTFYAVAVLHRPLTLSKRARSASVGGYCPSHAKAQALPNAVHAKTDTCNNTYRSKKMVSLERITLTVHAQCSLPTPISSLTTQINCACASVAGGFSRNRQSNFKVKLLRACNRARFCHCYCLRVRPYFFNLYCKVRLLMPRASAVFSLCPSYCLSACTKASRSSS